MRHALAAAILTASAPAWANQPITIAPWDNGFSVSSTATGSVGKDGPFLAVALTQHTLRANKGFDPQKKVLHYRVGLARNNAQGRWEVQRWSDSFPAAFSIQAGDTRQLPPTTALIPVDNIPSLRGSWIVVQVTVHSSGTTGTTYSHSGKLALD